MSDATEPRYGLDVQVVELWITCGDHGFTYSGPREGPTICPHCARRFILTYSFNVEPAPPGYKGLATRTSAKPPWTKAYVGADVSERDGHHRLDARVNELYHAMQTVEQYGGCSPEETETINQLGKRYQLLKDMREKAEK